MLTGIRCLPTHISKFWVPSSFICATAALLLTTECSSSSHPASLSCLLEPKWHCKHHTDFGLVFPIGYQDFSSPGIGQFIRPMGGPMPTAQDHLQLGRKTQERKTASPHQKWCFALSFADIGLLPGPEMLSLLRAGVSIPLEMLYVSWHMHLVGLCVLCHDLWKQLSLCQPIPPAFLYSVALLISQYTVDNLRLCKLLRQGQGARLSLC